MRKALSIVLAGLLVVLPVEQVLAQAAPQEAVSTQQTARSGGAWRGTLSARSLDGGGYGRAAWSRAEEAA